MDHAATADEPAPDFDVRRRYVRLTQVRADGLIEFDFAVGDPALAVELILPAAAFREFCAAQQAEQLPSAGIAAADGG